MARKNASFGDPIRIDNPPSSGYDYWPLCVTLDKDGYFTACGGTDSENVSNFESVTGSIYGVFDGPGTVNGRTWSIRVGPLPPGQQYWLKVEAVADFTSGSLPATVSNQVPFIAAQDGYYSCPSGHGYPAVSCGQASASGAQESQSGTLPRYYRVRLSEEIPGLASPCAGLLLGGLLAPSTVYLAYDPAASLGTAPVWRDVNLPEFIGRWTLRAALSRCGASAELVQQTIGPRYVSTGMVFRCTNWNSNHANRFQLVGPPGGVALSLIVEPA